MAHLQVAVIFCLITALTCVHYDPTWESLDKRPLPSWYDEAKFGIFLHWGVFSVPSFGGAWFQEYWRRNRTDIYYFMKDNYRPDFTYADFAADFTAEFYNPDEWAELFQASGARYVVLTSKHHEGFCNWDTKYSFNWNSMAVGPKRDLVGDLANSIRKKSTLKFGLYHSLFEFVNPLFLQDKNNKFKTQDFVQFKTMPELYELVTKYQPEVVWSDGQWMAHSSYWNSTNFLAWLYNESPVKDTVVTNDRWGSETTCKHGGFYTCHDGYNPGKLQNHKFEDCTTIDKHAWAFRRNAKIADFHTIEELITELAEVVSCGGNMLLNAGPTKYGTIAPVFEERLRQMGNWLQVNGEAIYGTKPWTTQNDTLTPGVCEPVGVAILESKSIDDSLWFAESKLNNIKVKNTEDGYTSKKTEAGTKSVYAIMLNRPKDSKLELSAPEPGTTTKVSLVGYEGSIPFKPGASSGMEIIIPQIPVNLKPYRWALVFKLENLKNQ